MAVSDTDPADPWSSRIEIINIDPERPSALSALEESLLSRISIPGRSRGGFFVAKLKSERFLVLVPPERESKSLGQIKIVGHIHGQLLFDGRVNGHGSSSERNKEESQRLGWRFLVGDTGETGKGLLGSSDLRGTGAVKMEVCLNKCRGTSI